MKLNGTNEAIEAVDYPATTDELIEAHGDRELELQRGTERLGDVLSRLDDEQFDTPEDVRLSVHCAVCHKAVGRRFYSDRDPRTPGDTGPTPMSL